MKKCNFCGKVYPADATVCATDGQPLQIIPPPPPPPFSTGMPDQQRVIDEEHLRLLSIFHFIVAGLAFCGLAFVFLHYLLMSSIFANPDFFKSPPGGPQMPKYIFNIFIWFYVFMGLMLVSAALGNLLSGIFLHQRKHRVFCIVIASLDCLQIPFGTVLGIFAIIVLSRDSVRKIYTQ